MSAMQKVIKTQTTDITALKAELQALGQGSSSVEALARRAAAAQASGGVAAIESGTGGAGLDNLKDDVQTVIDAMRFELQRQKSTIAQVERQVQSGQLESRAGAGAGASTFSQSNANDGQFVTTQRFDELYADCKKDIQMLSRTLEETGRHPKNLVTKTDFEKFSIEIGLQLGEVFK